jgi:hypothetical protein
MAGKQVSESVGNPGLGHQPFEFFIFGTHVQAKPADP